MLIAPEAAVRPAERTGKIVPAADCPFCPGHEQACGRDLFTLRNHRFVSNGSGWSLRVIPNQYPLLRIEAAPPRHDHQEIRRDGLGAHEVVIELPEHATLLRDYPVDLLVDVISAWRSRIGDLMNDSRLNFFLVHRSEGTGRQSHPHSQVFAFPQPFRASVSLLDDGPHPEHRRVIAHGPFVAFATYAQPYPFEIVISPVEPAISFVDLCEPDRLAGLIRDIWRRLELALKSPPIRLALRVWRHPAGVASVPSWQIVIRPELEMYVPVSWEAGLAVNPVRPEDACSILRDLERTAALPSPDWLIPVESVR